MTDPDFADGQDDEWDYYDWSVPPITFWLTWPLPDWMLNTSPDIADANDFIKKVLL
jgi:hypothetical protein